MVGILGAGNRVCLEAVHLTHIEKPAVVFVDHVGDAAAVARDGERKFTFATHQGRAGRQQDGALQSGGRRRGGSGQKQECQSGTEGNEERGD
jgi:hypothetical protein